MRRHSVRASAGCSPRCSASRPNGDYPAAKALFDTYGIHFDPALRDEIVARVDKLKLPSYTGFVQPKLEPVRDADGTIRDVKISYPQDLTQADARVLRGDQAQPRAVSCWSEPLMFSSRLRQAAGRNRLAVALDRRRAAGLPIIDLTLSNPTRAGFAYPTGLLAPMAQDRSLRYEPEPFGLLSARQAVSDELRAARSVGARESNRADRQHERGVFVVVQAAVRPGRCRAGAAAELSAGRASDAISTACLSSITASSFTAAGRSTCRTSREGGPRDGSRAIIMISPNNPTGSVVTDGELDAMAASRARARPRAHLRRGVRRLPDLGNAAGKRASPADSADVRARRFVEIRRPSPAETGLDRRRRPARPLVADALERLETICDAYLSVSTPVQVAAPDLLESRRRRANTDPGARVRRTAHSWQRSRRPILHVP